MPNSYPLILGEKEAGLNISHYHFLFIIIISLFTHQMPGWMGHGPAGGLGHPVHRGGRLVRGPVIIPHQMEAESPAWAPPHRPNAVNTTFLTREKMLR